MSIFNLIFAIALPFTLIIVFSYFVYRWYINSEKKLSTPPKGTSLFYLDLTLRKIKIVNTKIQFKAFFNNKDYSTWVPLDSLLRKLNDSESFNKLIRNIMHKLEKGSQEESIKFRYSVNNRKISIIKISFLAMENNSNHLMKFEWETKHSKKISHIKKIILSKEEVINNPSPVKGFVALNLNKKASNVEERLSTQVANIKCMKDLSFFVAGGMMVFVFFCKSKKQAGKKLKKFVYRARKKGSTRGMGLLYKGSAFVYSSKVRSVKSLKQILQTLDYLVVESLETENSFVGNIDESRKQEFRNFLEASKSYRNALKSGNVSFKNIPVRSYESNRKIIDYIFSEIKDINKVLLSKVLNNTNNKEKLVNVTADKVAIRNLFNKPILVDVGANWLIENQSKFRYQKAIYVINYNQDRPSSELRNSVSELTKKGFVFAIKIYKYNEDIVTFIKQINPQFLIISRKMKKNKKLYDSETIINLMTLNKICKAQSIKMIFETSPELIDDKLAKKIGLQFYYQ